MKEERLARSSTAWVNASRVITGVTDPPGRVVFAMQLNILMKITGEVKKSPFRTFSLFFDLIKFF